MTQTNSPHSTASGTTPVTEISIGDAPDRRRSAFAGQSIHFIGIGGCGMSGLARLLRDSGATCRGTDRVASDVTERLSESGIDVATGPDEALPAEGTDLVVASAAVPPDHPAMIDAQNRGLRVMTYAEALGAVQAERTGISIAGTHGKSTTSAMLCHVLLTCGLEPGYIVGANCEQIGGGSRVGAEVIGGHGPLSGRPGMLICEACEFNRSFHCHRPTLGLINNVEEDHLDIYGSIDQIVQAFRTFAELIPRREDGGWLLIAHDGAHRRTIASGLECAVETFGFSPAADYRVELDPARGAVELHHDGDLVTAWTLSMPGEHNALNSAAAAIIAHHVGASWEAIGPALTAFNGLDRRMQRLGERPLATGGSVVVYDDYGHHPTEIEITLRALRHAENPERLVCVFQPHQHSRTRFLLDEFAQSFSSADVVIVPPIYFVRDSEIERQKVSARDLVDRLRSRGVHAMHVYPFDAIVEQLEVIARPGDLVVIMGAGPVWQIAHSFLSRAEAAS